MPKEAIELGAVDEVAARSLMPAAILRRVSALR
jgi:hypothetical protein